MAKTENKNFEPFTVKNCEVEVKKYFFDKAEKEGTSASFEARQVLKKHFKNNQREFYGE